MLGFVAASGECQPATADSTRVWRESLRAADAAASTAAFKRGLAEALSLVMTDDAVLLWDAAPIVSGRAGIQQLLAVQSTVRVSWQPFRVLVSSDGRFGVTFGATSRYGDGATPAVVSRYISVWRRVSPDGWKIAATALIGVASPDSVKLPAFLAGVMSPDKRLRDQFAAVDNAFARMAVDSGAPAAFYYYGAPDAMTLAGTGELNVGPAGIRARLAEGPVGKAKWEWRPVVTIAAPSGDLAATIGTAEIRLGPGPDDVFFSKYMTIWKRQPDGFLRFVVDGGSGRPPTR